MTPLTGAADQAGISTPALRSPPRGRKRSLADALDTLIVRSVLVTALNLDAGHRMWWPGKLARKPDPAPEQLRQERTAALAAG